MAWPTNKPDSNAFASDTNSIKESRPELNTMSQAVNDIVDFVDTSGIQNGDVLVYDSVTDTIKPGLNYQLLQITAGENVTVVQDSAGGVTISSQAGTEITAGAGISVSNPDSAGDTTVAFSGNFTNGGTTYDFDSTLEINATTQQARIAATNATNQGLYLDSYNNQQRIILEGGSGGNIVLNPGSGNNVQINASVNKFYLPSTDGTSGQVMTTDGLGNLSWTTTALGTDTQLTAGTGINITQPDSAGSWHISSDIQIQGGEGITVNQPDSAGAFTISAQQTHIEGGTGITVTQPDSAGGYLISADPVPETQIVAGTGISVSQDDSAGSYTITNTITSNETQITGGDGITVTKADSAGQHEIAFSGQYTVDSNNANNTTYEFQDTQLAISSTLSTPQIQSTNASYPGLILKAGVTNLAQIVMTGTSSGNIEITPHSGGKVRISNAYNLPNTDGSNGQVLQTDGAGNLSFVTPAGGGGTTEITAGDNITVSQPDSTGAFQIAFSDPLTNPINVNDQSINDAVFKGYSETVYSGLSTSGTLTPDVSNGNVQTVTLSGNITINSLSSVANGDSVTIIITQPASGGPYTLSSTMKFAGGNKTLSTGANEIDVLSIFYDGTNYLASLGTNFS